VKDEARHYRSALRSCRGGLVDGAR
jgi:hypothetical protein